MQYLRNQWSDFKNSHDKNSPFRTQRGAAVELYLSMWSWETVTRRRRNINENSSEDVKLNQVQVSDIR